MRKIESVISLILMPQINRPLLPDSWTTPSQMVWSQPTQLPDKLVSGGAADIEHSVDVRRRKRIWRAHGRAILV